MHSLIEDVATLTTIPPASLSKLINKAKFCVCECVAESALKNEPLTEIDVGLGTLQINVEDNAVQYRFVPNKNMENSIRTTIMEKKSPLVEHAEESLVQRIMNTYKDYL